MAVNREINPRHHVSDKGPILVAHTDLVYRFVIICWLVLWRDYSEMNTTSIYILKILPPPGDIKETNHSFSIFQYFHVHKKKKSSKYQSTINIGKTKNRSTEKWLQEYHYGL